MESIIYRLRDIKNDEYFKFTFNYDIEEIKKWSYNPVRLNIQLTKLCNQKCISCNCGPDINIANELKANEIKELIKNVTSIYDIKNIAFTGGEPLTKNDFLDIAKYASNFSEKVSITTNAQLIKDVNYAKKLIESGVNNFTLSYHGIGVHDLFTRRSGAEEKLRKGLRSLKTAAKDLGVDIRIKIGHLLTKLSYDNLNEMMAFCEDENVELYLEIPTTDISVFEDTEIKNIELKDKTIIEQCIKLLRKWKFEGKPIMLSDEAIVFLEKYMNKQPIKSPCPIGFYDIYVDSIGDFYTGCWGLSAIGNIKEKNIQEILTSDKLYENIYMMLRRECKGCTCGYNMMARYYIPYLIESEKKKHEIGD